VQDSGLHFASMRFGVGLRDSASVRHRAEHLPTQRHRPSHPTRWCRNGSLRVRLQREPWRFLRFEMTLSRRLRTQTFLYSIKNPNQLQSSTPSSPNTCLETISSLPRCPPRATTTRSHPATGPLEYVSSLIRYDR